MLDPFHLGLGVISSAIVTYLSKGMLFRSKHKSYGFQVRTALLLPTYMLWLFKEIIFANFYILYLAFHPRLYEKLNPRIFSIKSDKLKDDFAFYVMGISITLVPGTVTIDIEKQDSEIIVHAITDQASEGLPDPMDSKIANIFCVKGEEPV